MYPGYNQGDYDQNGRIKSKSGAVQLRDFFSPHSLNDFSAEYNVVISLYFMGNINGRLGDVSLAYMNYLLKRLQLNTKFIMRTEDGSPRCILEQMKDVSHPNDV